MTTARREQGRRRGLRARIALGVLVVSAPTEAAADGEKTPMFGAAIVGARAPEHDAELLGVAVEAAWWWGWLGFAAEGSMRWDLDDGGPRAAVLGASVRVRVLDYMVPALLEPRDVELGVELHGIVEHAWWDRAAAPNEARGYGLGLALRLRGGEEDDSSSLLAESRLFVRAVTSREPAIGAIARTTMPHDDEASRELTVVIGIGASFGAGEAGYVERFRWRTFDPPTLRLRSAGAYGAGPD